MAYNNYKQQQQDNMQQEIDAPQQPEMVSMDQRYMQNLGQNTAQVINVKLNNSDIIDEIEMFLRGAEWDPQQKSYVKLKEQLLNDKGIGLVLQCVYAYTSKIITLGNLDIQEAKDRAYLIEESLIDIFYERYDEFGLSESYASIIVQTVGDLVYSSLTRSVGGAENKGISETTNIVEHIREAANKPSMFSGVTKLFGGR